MSNVLEAKYDSLALEAHGETVWVVRLNRPEASNAINTRMGEELVAVFESIALDPGSLRCIVLTGSGDKAFCAGGDLRERRGMTEAQWRAQHLVFERMIRAILGCPVPVVAAVNGSAFGGGCEIASACDFIYAAEEANFAQTEVRLGIIPGCGGTQTLARAVGERRAKEIVLGAAPFSSREAHAWGLVNTVVPRTELMTTALALADRIAANAPLAVRQAKQAIGRGIGLSIWDALAFELEAYYRLVPTEDRQEGVNAFNEKRSPKFRGL
jgi:enoyl-CoA hydratase